MKNKLRIGAVNWDAGLPADTYFGHYTLNTLGNEKYAERLPYYATKDENGGYSIPMRTREQYDRELAMAADAAGPVAAHFRRRAVIIVKNHLHVTALLRLF